MKQKTAVEAKPGLLGQLQPTLGSANEAVAILSSAAEEMLRIQSAAGSAFFTEWLSDCVSIFSPRGQDYLLQKMPERYRSQSDRSVKVLFDSAGGLWHAQQRLLEWQLECARRTFSKT